MATLLERFEEIEGTLQDLRTRMDNDKELKQLKAYVMENAKGANVLNVVNVTLNRPAVFAANVESSLNSATEQVNIISEDKKVDKDHIADCVRAGFLSADNLMKMRGKFPLNPFIDQQMCERGRMACRVCFRLVKGRDESGKSTMVLKPDIMPWDGRWCAWDTGEDGLNPAGYRTTRSKSDILAEYPDVDLGANKSAEVVDIWTPEYNEVYIDSKQVIEQKNPYGFTPVCGQIVTLGSMLADNDSTEHWGESIFFLIRQCIPELNRVISIMQTLNMISVKPPKGLAVEDPDNYDTPLYDEVMAAGSLTAHEKNGGGIKDINFGDLKNAAIYAMNALDRAIDEGSVEITSIGNLPGQISAVALIEIGEGRDQVFLPRLGARGLLKQQIADMFIRQIVATGESKVELGTKGRARIFDVKKLQGQYEIEYNYHVKSPKIDVARYSVAQAAKSVGIPQEDIDRDILQLEDPQGTALRRNREKAAALSPLVAVIDIIKSLSQSEDDDDQLVAEVLAEQFNIDFDQMIAGNAPTLQTQDNEPVNQNGEGLMPLYREMTRPNSAKEAANLQAQPRQSEGE